MTILERLLRHDAATTRALLALSAELSDDALDQPFDIGHRTLRRTFAHIIDNMECWCDLMTGSPQRPALPSAQPPDAIANLISRLDIVAGELLKLGAKVDNENRQDDFFTDYLDHPPRQKPLGGGLVHLTTHAMHHRAQCLFIMRKLGVIHRTEGDALTRELEYRGLKEWPAGPGHEC